MKLYTTVAEINKAIASIQKRGQKLDLDIQITGVSVLKHVAEHGDTTILDRLVGAMPKGARKSAFCEWAVAFGNVRLLDRGNEADKSAIEQGRLFAKDKSKEFKEELAIENKWYDFKPEKDLLTTFDINKLTQQLIKRLSKAKKDGAEVVGQAEALKSLRALTQALAVDTETL